MIKFEVNQKVGPKIALSVWQQWLKEISLPLKLAKDLSLSIALVGKAEIKNLNFFYRQKNKITDVLSFAEKDMKAKRFIGKDGGYLGEIVLCYPLVVSQAKQAEVSVRAELRRLFVHGFLHLLGYDHQKEKEAKKMESLERKILGN